MISKLIKYLVVGTLITNKSFGAEEGGMPQLNPEYWVSQIFWLIVTFGSLYIILSQLILPKISKNLETRKAQVLNNIEQAEKFKKESEKKIKEYEEILSNARKQSKVIINEAKNKVNQDIGNLPNKKMTFTQTVHYLSELRNDLELPAFELIPNIKNVITLLNNSGSSLSRMSGSGGTCFGLFADFELAKSAANNISTDNPNWWVQPVILG